MENLQNPTIYTTDTSFDFSKLLLMQPNGMQGGSYYTKLQINQNSLYLQTPKCTSKQGVVITNGKKSYIDFVFSNEDIQLIEFIENLEKTCCEKIYEKKDLWFNNDIELSDIENAFTSALRPYKGGKNYLLRANILPSKNLLNTQTCFVFDENENSLSLDTIKPENTLVSILELQGIKFTARSFQFEIILKQVLVISNKPIFQSCVIKKNSIDNTSHTISNNSLHNDNDNDKHNENIIINTEIKHCNSNEDNNNVLQETSLHENIKNSNNIEPELIALNNNDLELNTLEINNLSEINIETINKPLTNDVNVTNFSIPIKVKKNEYEEIKSTLVNNTIQPNIEFSNDLVEINLETTNKDPSNTIKLKKPSDVYYEIYRLAKEKARYAKKLALDAYLEAKNIKNTYMLDDSDNSGSDDDIISDESDEEL